MSRPSTGRPPNGQATDTEYRVTDIFFSVHTKRDAPEDHPRTLRVDYRLGFSQWQSEWVCLEHTGYARAKAEAWWRKRSREPVPETIEQAVDICEAGGIAPTLGVTVRSVTGEKYDRIVAHELGAIPPRLDGGDECAADEAPAYTWAGDEVPF